MKLLKSFGGEEIEMKVVSPLDSTSSMVSAEAVSGQVGWDRSVLTRRPFPASCLPPAQHGTHSLRVRPEMCSLEAEGSRGNFQNFNPIDKILSGLIFLIKLSLITDVTHMLKNVQML